MKFIRIFYVVSLKIDLWNFYIEGINFLHFYAVVNNLTFIQRFLFELQMNKKYIFAHI